jgi:two-component system NarL family sensor kinase
LWLGSLNQDDRSVVEMLPFVVLFLVFVMVGVAIVSRQPANAIGWLFCAIGAGATFSNLAQDYATYTFVTRPHSLPFGLAIGWVANWSWYASVGSISFLLLLFPTGKPLSRRWRLLVWCTAAGLAAALAPFAFGEGEFESTPVQNPLGWSGGRTVLDGAAALGAILFVVGFLGAVVSLIVRARRSSGDERQQLKWLAYGGASLFLMIGVVNPAMGAIFPSAHGLGDLTFGIALMAIPVSTGVAILKYRLYDIDRLINRSLVFALLSAGVIGLYIGTVAIFDNVLERRGTGVTLLATALAAVLFQPFRERLQRGVNRLMYGDRDDPYGAISRFGQRLESDVAPEEVLPSIAEGVAETLRLPYVAIELLHGGVFERIASFGRETPEGTSLPLVYQGTEIGRLIVAPRSRGEPFSRSDLDLLNALARQAGVAAHSVQLNAELQLSRERLVETREEERRRLRNDLHDGLGPTLAGMGLELETVRNIMKEDPEAADALLTKISEEARTAVSDVRKLVYGLRPPALDELGLLGAIREQALRFGPRSDSVGVDSLSVTVRGEELRGLSAAVEVAAYRIAVEGLTNAVRHSKGRNVEVSIALTEELQIEICDDGEGIAPAARAGVGLSSMRERAAELGGTVMISPGKRGGTRVLARLPIDGAERDG